MGKEEFGHPRRIDVFGTWNDDHPLRKVVVDHDHDRVFTGYFGKIRDEINGDLFEWEVGGRGNRGEWGSNGVGVYFVLLTGGTSFDETIDEDSKSRPPEVLFYERFGAEASRMS